MKFVLLNLTAALLAASGAYAEEEPERSFLRGFDIPDFESVRSTIHFMPAHFFFVAYLDLDTLRLLTSKLGFPVDNTCTDVLVGREPWILHE